AISDDGQTVVGQVVDWSGFYIYPIIYTQNEAGEWSYRTISEGILYPEGAEFPAWPGEEPSGEEYMTEEELTAYLEAVNNYMIEMNKYMNGETDICPDEPYPGDYIVERKEEYKAAVYQYQQRLMYFDEIFMNTMYNTSFIFNNVYLSGNGRYYNTTIEKLDATDPMRPFTTSTPICIDLENGDSMVSVAGATDMIASSVMNDGRTIAQTPKMAYARNSFIVSADGKTMTPFVDYICGLDNATGQWLKELSSFQVLVPTEFDENGYPINYQYVDSIVSGSVYCNSDGTVFGSFMYDEWSDYVTYRQFSYSINLNELEAVEGIESDREWDVYVAEKTLYINGEVSNITLYDLRGAIIAQYEYASGAIALDVANGIYLVRCENNNGTRTYKVAVK
ncbi:MAG: T9SS type A sorting domain-containing protein, partial [Bacteroidaceae bacterium]|nr:T9SS type A sorting domain-containing protein [Bacteroidaceae bacterium]